MQVIWSRAAQTRSCRCHSCLQSATLVARRTTTAASKQRLKTSDVFTACYSAMFATAALVDMKLKHERRKQWDLAIAEAKSSSNVTMPGDAISALEGVAHKFETNNSDPQSLVQCLALSILGTHKWPPTDSPAKIGRSDQNLTSLSNPQDTRWMAKLITLDTHLQGSPTAEEHQAVDERSIQVEKKAKQFGTALGYRKKLKAREPKDFVHLKHMQQMVLRLVTRLLVTEEPFSTNSSAATHKAAALFEAGYIWEPKYSLLTKEVVRERTTLNKAIANIMMRELVHSANVGSMVAKICYNLLISSAPPSIDTYNIMLKNFTRLRQNHLAQIVVDSFLEDSKFGPTERTIAAILDHYAAKKDQVGFNSIIQRMRGAAGNMRVVTWQSSCLGPDDPVVPWRGRSQNVMHRHQVLLAKVPRDTVIFESLIVGSLGIYGSRRAVMYLKAALRERCHVSVSILKRVARACLSERNEKAAIALLSAIVSQWNISKECLSLEFDAGLRMVILKLMHLCGIEPSLNANHPLPGVLRKIDFQIFKAWSRAIRLELLNDYVMQSAKCIADLEVLLATALSKTTNTEHIILWMHKLIDSQLDEELKEESRPLVTSIQLIIEEFSNSFKDIETQLSDILAGFSADYQQRCAKSPLIGYYLKVGKNSNYLPVEA